MDAADACRERGVKPVAVTAGYICDEPRVSSTGTWTPPTSTSRRSPRLLQARHRLAPPAGARHARLPEPRDRRVVRDHQPRDPRHNDADDEIEAMSRGSPSTSARTCPCTSRRSILTSRCSTSRGHRPARSRVPETSPCATGCGTCTRATFTTRPVRARTARAVDGGWWNALVGARQVPPDGRRPLPVLWHADPWTLRRPAGQLGRPAAAGVAGHAMTRHLRRAAVAGRFYPADPALLERTVQSLLDDAAAAGDDEPAPKAIIAPHAGYRCSGPIAATAYASIAPARGPCVA